MRKVIVIGAGIGGLYAAKRLSSLGYNVTVIESRAREDLGYPWYDSVEPTTFSDVGMVPPEGVCIPKQVLNYYAPSGKGKIKQPDRAGKSLDVHRIKLIRYMMDMLEPHCTLRFEERVKSLVIEEGAVRGVVTERETLRADLVIDASGLFSPCRLSTPDFFLLNDPLCEHDYIVAYREVYSRRETAEEPAPNVYLYPKGLMLAWCKTEPDMDGMDVFLGSYEEITPAEKERALAFLREHNPALGDTLLSTRKECVPLRYPMGVLSAPGYVIVGNSAFMTQPFCGSGIEVSLKAAADLVDVIKQIGDDPFTAENLWPYTLRFVRRFGAYYAAQYVFRQAVEVLPSVDLDFLFTSGLFDEGIVALATLDRKFIKKINFRSFWTGFRSALSRNDIVTTIKGAFAQAVQAYILARSLPSKYEYDVVARWKGKYDSMMRAAPEKIRRLFLSTDEK